MRNLNFILIFAFLLQACSQSETNRSVNSGQYDYLYKNLPFDMPRVEEPVFPDNEENIARHGAISNGVTLNTDAFAKAIETLTKKGGGTVIVPRGIWLTGPIVLQSNINLHLEEGSVVLFSPELALYPVIETFFEGRTARRCQSPVSGKGLTNIAITGKGLIDGWGEAWRPVKQSKLTESQWKKLLTLDGTLNARGDIWSPPDNREFLRPVMISLQECNKVLLEGVTFQNSPSWNIHPLMCENFIARGITVLNPWWSQNGDGLDLESCRNALVVDCSFDVGDDAICIKSGKDEEGRKRGKPTENVIIDNCVVYHGHGGFVVGSEMSGGVRNIKVSNCTFMGTDVGLRFKSNRGRGGVVEKIYISDIYMVKIPTEPLLFDLYYGGAAPGEESMNNAGVEEQMPPVTEATPQFKDIYISDVVCNGAARAMFFNGLPEMNVSNVNITNVTITADRGAIISESDGVKLNNLRVIAAQGANLILHNAKNIEINGFTANGSDKASVNISGKRTQNVHIAKSAVGKDDIKIEPSVSAEQVKIQ